MSFYLSKSVYDACKEEIEFTLETILKNVAVQNQSADLLLPFCRAYGIITYAIRPTTDDKVKIIDENEWELCLTDLQDIVDSLRYQANDSAEYAQSFHMAANVLLRAFTVLRTARTYDKTVFSA